MNESRLPKRKVLNNIEKVFQGNFIIYLDKKEIQSGIRS